MTKETSKPPAEKVEKPPESLPTARMLAKHFTIPPKPVQAKPRQDRIIHYEWHNKPETCIIGGKKYTYKSQIERKWAEYLQKLKDLGAIIDWFYEPKTFEFTERFRHKRIYTLDFSVTEEERHKITTVYHEVKTSLRQTDIRRFRYMAMDYPDVRMVLVLPYCAKNTNQARLRGNALRYCERIVYCNALFNKFSIR